ncbi:hypothetical protein R1sor_005115 [Riccia sorocarpa]|uniref:Transposase n=1 Tax=Riccia sorocarpa TaxID=122646 RepID=A0ABD3HMF3_9MARC
MPPWQRPPDTRRGDRHTPRGCPEAPGGLIRVPQSHVDIWSRCRRALSEGGPLVSNAEVLRWLLETARPFVERMLPNEAREEEEAPVDIEAQERVIIEEANPVVGTALVTEDQQRVIIEEANPAVGATPVTEDQQGRRRVPNSAVGEDRVHDSQSSTDRVLDSQPVQLVSPNPDPSRASIVDGLPRYGFISARKLFELFQTFQVRCPRQGCEQFICVQSMSSIHQTYKMKLSCPHQHYYPFMTSEFELYYGVHAVTTLMYHSALCAGLTYTQLDALYMEAGIARVSENQFMGFQSGGNRRMGWIEVVLERWAEEKADVHRQIRHIYFLEDQPRRHFVVYADLRYDSSRNGFNGTCAFINRDDGRVVELVNIQRTETSNNSWLIEYKAFEAGLERLQAAGILPDEVVHDDKSSVDAILRRFGIVSQKDLWHKCKNVLKKFIVDVQQKKRTATSVREATSVADLQMLTKTQLEHWLRESTFSNCGIAM